jgi:hypothetical protein
MFHPDSAEIEKELHPEFPHDSSSRRPSFMLLFAFFSNVVINERSLSTLLFERKLFPPSNHFCRQEMPKVASRVYGEATNMPRTSIDPRKSS